MVGFSSCNNDDDAEEDDDEDDKTLTAAISAPRLNRPAFSATDHVGFGDVMVLRDRTGGGKERKDDDDDVDRLPPPN